MEQRMRRRGFTIGLLSLGLLAGVALTAGLAQAASSNGPYYAEPAWDQKLPAATRFIVLTDWNSEAVLDRETGLMWEKSPDVSVRSWAIARTGCVNRILGGDRMGWRLPSVSELASLVDPSVSSSPKLPTGHPFVNVQTTSNYWSSSTSADLPDRAWVVTFGLGGGVFTNDKTENRNVWCVRGGMNADAY